MPTLTCFFNSRCPNQRFNPSNFKSAVSPELLSFSSITTTFLPILLHFQNFSCLPRSVSPNLPKQLQRLPSKNGCALHSPSLINMPTGSLKREQSHHLNSRLLLLPTMPTKLPIPQNPVLLLLLHLFRHSKHFYHPTNRKRNMLAHFTPTMSNSKNRKTSKEEWLLLKYSMIHWTIHLILREQRFQERMFQPKRTFQTKRKKLFNNQLLHQVHLQVLMMINQQQKILSVILFFLIQIQICE
mmetsp:Transcript_19505/g.29070  ORF Transcript_19505/g.29070 Transcript_19505/m.29070 type:complete len:241 (+) Transcript_19505:899-1621(+)